MNNVSKQNDTEKPKPIDEIVKETLAQHIGVEPGDIELEDSFGDDLHMSATDLVDFINTLSEYPIDVENIDLTEIVTVEDLIETLSHNEIIE